MESEESEKGWREEVLCFCNRYLTLLIGSFEKKKLKTLFLRTCLILAKEFWKSFYILLDKKKVCEYNKLLSSKLSEFFSVDSSVLTKPPPWISKCVWGTDQNHWKLDWNTFMSIFSTDLSMINTQTSTFIFPSCQ